MRIVLTQALRLDEVVFQHYGNLENFDLILENNPKLANKDILEAGTEVELVELEEKSNINEVKTLWD